LSGVDVAAAVSGSTGKLFSGVPFRERPSRASTSSKIGQEAIGKSTLKWLADAVPCQGTQWAVLTTINEPSLAVQNLMNASGWCMVVIGDLKGPKTYDIPGVRPDSLLFLDASFQNQITADSAFFAQIPWNHFARKNIGYVIAIARGARIIWDFDDDNVVTASSFPPPLQEGSLDVLWAPRGSGELKNATVLNVYPSFGCPISPCWPRGFPLTLLRSEPPSRSEWTRSEDSKNVAILQSLANNDPDMDAIFRLVSPKPSGLYFRPLGPEALGLPPFIFCPANAQATLHRRDAFWGLLLPMTVSGRVSDIWRSYLVQRLLWDTGLRLAFAPPLVRQDRNVHNYIADFNAERQLYLQTEKFLEFLGSWESSESTLPERMEDLWGAAYERGYVEISDLESLWLWIDALKLVGYAFPDVMDSSDTNSPSPSPYNGSAASEKRHHGNKNRRKKQNSTQRGKGKAQTPDEPQPPT
jgi:hypothetical protein